MHQGWVRRFLAGWGLWIANIPPQFFALDLFILASHYSSYWTHTCSESLESSTDVSTHLALLPRSITSLAPQRTNMVGDSEMSWLQRRTGQSNWGDKVFIDCHCSCILCGKPNKKPSPIWGYTPILYIYAYICTYIYWLVVWNIFYFLYIGNNNPNWLIFFRGVPLFF